MCLYVRGKEQKRLEKEDYIQQLGKPKYKVGEEVCFVYGKDRDQEAKGRICIIDAYGTWEQQEEVSYDILGSRSEEADRRVLFKHIRESEIVNKKRIAICG